MIDKKTILRLFYVACGCIFVYWLLHETERVQSVLAVLNKIFSPFVLGAALAFILNVPMRAFENVLRDIRNPGLRRVIAVLLTFATVILVVAMVFWLLIPQLVETFQSLVPKIYSFILATEALIDEFLAENPELLKWITENTELESLDWATLARNVVAMIGNSVTKLFNSAVGAIGSITGAIVNLVIGLVFALYCLFGKENLARQGRRVLYAFFPEKFSDEVVRILRLTNTTFSNFLSGQCLEVCILGAMFAVAMTIFKMPYVVLVSVLVAVTAFIPVVGAFVGCIFGAFFILVNDSVQALGFVALFLILQQIENNMVYPRVVGTSIGLPGMWVLLAVAIGGELMGVSGMFLMIPMTSVVYTLLREFTAKRLTERNINPEKIKAQPPELRSSFEERKNASRRKRTEKEAKKDRIKWELKKKQQQ